MQSTAAALCRRTRKSHQVVQQDAQGRTTVRRDCEMSRRLEALQRSGRVPGWVGAACLLRPPPPSPPTGAASKAARTARPYAAPTMHADSAAQTSRCSCCKNKIKSAPRATLLLLLLFQLRLSKPAPAPPRHPFSCRPSWLPWPASAEAASPKTICVTPSRMQQAWPAGSPATQSETRPAAAAAAAPSTAAAAAAAATAAAVVLLLLLQRAALHLPMPVVQVSCAHQYIWLQEQHAAAGHSGVPG